MKKESIKKVRRLLAFVALLLCSVMLLSSCSDFKEKNSEVEALGREMLGYIIEDDFDSAYALVDDTADEETFREVYDYVRQMLDGNTEYTLKANGWKSNTSNGVTTHVVSFMMTLENGNRFQVDFGVRDGIEGLATFYITPVSNTKLSGFGVTALDIIIKVFSLAALAFAVWMIVDCARRKIKWKALWIIIIYLGIQISLTISGSNISFGGSLGIMISTSDISMKYGAVSIKLLIPIGAIIYFFVRNRLPSPNDKKLASDNSEQIARNESGTAEENQAHEESTEKIEKTEDTKDTKDTEENN